MAERASWAVGSDSERLLSAEDARIAWAGLLTPARSGFQPAGGADPGRVFATTPTPNGSVHVEPFTYHLQSARGGGVYTLTLDAIHDLDILSAAPAHPGNNRHDLIVAQQSDLFFGDTDSRMRIRHMIGAPSGAPQDPPVDGSLDHVKLARVVVRANASDITDSDIEPLRPADRHTVALGGVLPVPNLAARTAITAPFRGMTIYRQDQTWLEVHDGTAWRVPGAVPVANLADITNPVAGQLVVFGGNLHRFDGTAWLPVGVLAGRILSTTGPQYSGIGSAEVHLAKLATTGVRITAGRVYELKVNLLANFTASGNSFTIRIRRDAPLTGPVLAEWSWQSGVTGFDDARTFAQEWTAPATATSVPFFVSAIRAAGTGTMSVYGNRRTTFRVTDVGSGGVWDEVT